MATKRSGPYRVKLDGKEVRIEDLPALAALVRDGRLGPDEAVLPPGELRWRTARDLPELRPHFPVDDPWAAWDGLDPHAARSALEEYEPEEPVSAGPEPIDAHLVEPLPDVQFAPDDDERTDPGRAEAQPPPPPERPRKLVIHSNRAAGPREPPPAPPPPPEPPPRRVSEGPLPGTGGKVIAFPRSRGAVVAGATALAPAEPPAPAQEETGPPPRGNRSPRTRLAFIASAGLVAICGALAVRWYVRTEATWTPPAPAAVAPPPPREVAAAPTGRDVYVEMEDELRARLLPEALEVSAPGDLEDALLVELRKLHVDVARVDANVIAWTGRKNDVPEVAEVRVRFRSRPGEIDREIAAIALVVGKYAQHYDLEVPRFEAVFGGGDDVTLRRSLDPRNARLLYTRQLDVPRFLEAEAGGAGVRP